MATPRGWHNCVVHYSRITTCLFHSQTIQSFRAVQGPWYEYCLLGNTQIWNRRPPPLAQECAQVIKYVVRFYMRCVCKKNTMSLSKLHYFLQWSLGDTKVKLRSEDQGLGCSECLTSLPVEYMQILYICIEGYLVLALRSRELSLLLLKELVLVRTEVSPWITSKQKRSVTIFTAIFTTEKGETFWIWSERLLVGEI